MMPICMLPEFNSAAFIPKIDTIDDSGSCIVASVRFGND